VTWVSSIVARIGAWLVAAAAAAAFVWKVKHDGEVLGEMRSDAKSNTEVTNATLKAGEVADRVAAAPDRDVAGGLHKWSRPPQ
jgi:hypothetical protein